MQKVSRVTGEETEAGRGEGSCYCLHSKCRAQIQTSVSFPLPYWSQAVEGHKFKGAGMALTTSQEASQYEEAPHLWGSGKENAFHEVCIKSCPHGPLRLHPWCPARPHPLVLAINGEPQPEKTGQTRRWLKGSPRGQRGIHGVLSPIETGENRPTTSAPSAENGSK